MEQHINGYALAILELATESKELKTYKNEVNEIYYLLKSNPKYVDIIDSHILDKETKLKLINKAFDKKIKTSLLNFMLILVERGHARAIVPALRKSKTYINDSLNIHEGIVYSIEKLTPATIKKIEKTTSDKLGFKVNLFNRIDTELISGIRVVVRGKVIDNSIDSQLENMKQELLERQVK